MLTGEAGTFRVLADRRGPHGTRSSQPRELGSQLLQGLCIPFEHRFDVGRVERETGRNRESGSQGSGERRGLAAEVTFVERVDERRGHYRAASTSSTVPASPLTRTRAPSANIVVASRVPTTAGIPYSRATIAACESWPPRSVTMAPRSGRTTLKEGPVVRVTSTSPCCSRLKSCGPATTRTGPS